MAVSSFEDTATVVRHGGRSETGLHPAEVVRLRRIRRESRASTRRQGTYSPYIALPRHPGEALPVGYSVACPGGRLPGTSFVNDGILHPAAGGKSSRSGRAIPYKVFACIVLSLTDNIREGTPYFAGAEIVFRIIADMPAACPAFVFVVFEAGVARADRRFEVP